MIAQQNKTSTSLAALTIHISQNEDLVTKDNTLKHVIEDSPLNAGSTGTITTTVEPNNNQCKERSLFKHSPSRRTSYEQSSGCIFRFNAALSKAFKHRKSPIPALQWAGSEEVCKHKYIIYHGKYTNATVVIS